MRRTALGLALGLLVAACGGSSNGGAASISANLKQIALTSPAFVSGGPIPREYTCDGRDVSPPLRWSGVPPSATQLYLVMLDRSSKQGTFHHWAMLFPPTARGLDAGEVPPGAQLSANDFGRSGYSGPCPPRGDPAHHYLIGMSALAGNTTVAYGALTGTYARR